MAEIVHFDISDSPELLRIAAAVEKSGKPHLLLRKDKELALIVPVSARRRRKQRTPEEIRAALRASAGTWYDVDTDALIEQIYADRRRSIGRIPDL